jgi:hypothetical protein
MSNALTPSDFVAIGDLPSAVRTEVTWWEERIREATKPITKWARQMAHTPFCASDKTAINKYYAYKNCGWRGLVDLAKCPAWKKKWIDKKVEEAEASEKFVQWFKALAESNQRKTRPAHRKFCALWASGAEIPGLDNSLPRHELPPGCSYKNLTRKITDAFATEAMRIGLSSAIGKFGPQVFSTRVGLWVGSHVMIDDVRHDNFVTFKGRPVRVDELNLLDVFSGNKPAWGCKPRFERADGTEDGLKERYARLIVAQYFWNHGFSPRGTICLTEHGTAHLSDRVIRILHDRTGGLVRVRESGITGEEQAIVGYYGQGKGNFRFKAALESLHNLIHNELGDAPGQAGRNRDSRPEYTNKMLTLSHDLCKAVEIVAQTDPLRARQIKNPLLEYHSEFLPLLTDVYARINARDWHKLEGWHDCGHVTTKYRLSPAGLLKQNSENSPNSVQTPDWLSADDFNALPVAIREAVLGEIQKGHSGYTAPHVMSPAEVFARGRGELDKLPMFVVGEILAEDYASEREVRGAYFNEFSDQEIAPEPMLFESVIINPDGGREQLKDGKYLTFVNPFDARWLFVHAADGRCLGVAQRARRVQRTDPHAIEREFGNRNKRLQELLAPIRKRHAQDVREQTRIAESAIEVLTADDRAARKQQQKRQRVANAEPEDFTAFEKPVQAPFTEPATENQLDALNEFES